MNLLQTIFLALLGLSAGMIVAGGVFSFIVELFGGIFVGCWAMALAEILNVFPIFMRRARIVRYLAVFVVMVALGKGIGAGLFFWKRW